ncbi:efflux RND transporter permease subunit [Anaeromyxobacter sp. Red801]|uniref:efflux RND transporter permease subunit n=1 Tax=Anaeromyxobacter sp. Red801 TaxID=3411632 RepID=UPI003BA03DC6
MRRPAAREPGPTGPEGAGPGAAVQAPPHASPEPFDPADGSWLERLVFGHRAALVVAAALVTVALGTAAATRHVVSADLDRITPGSHPFVQASRARADRLRGLGNNLLVVVENARGDVWDAAYLEALRDASDTLFLMPGVDRPWVKSLWTPSVRWTEVTEEGFRGGPVMPDPADGSPEAIAALRRNVRRAGLAGTLVALDERSSAVQVPLLDRDPVTGAGLDYRALSAELEALRLRLEGPAGDGPVRVRIVGFAKRVGAILDGTLAVGAWFGVAAAIAAAILWLSSRCVRSTALVLACSGVALVWQLGIVSLLGVPLDPFSVLVPFLIFAMGVSHGTQKMNGVLQDVGRGADRRLAARRTFRRLFLAGLTALLTDAVGFSVLALVDVPAIRQLALTATVGVGVLIVTNLVLLPVLLSYTGVSGAAALRSLRGEAGGAGPGGAWRLVDRFTEPRWAAGILAVSAVLVAVGLAAGRGVPVGSTQPGAPELRADARYNRDDAYIAAHYGASSDVFAVMVETPPEGCTSWETLVEADRLGWALRQVPGVQATASLADAVRQITAGSFEGSPKWLTLSRDPRILGGAAEAAGTRNPDLFDPECTVMPVLAYLSDHRADTLDRVVAAADAFARDHAAPGRAFLLAAGNAGVEAATNLAVREAQPRMTACVFAAVVALCLLVFRSWRAVVVTVVPLATTAVLCQAVMAWLGIGMTIATLPVIALGVGIPDFALYLLSVQLAHQRAGAPLGEAHRRALRFTGRPVVLVAVTLAAGVVTWAFSPLRLQADMGVLLTFMFLGNMVAAVALVPALSRLLLREVPAR